MTLGQKVNNLHTIFLHCLHDIFLWFGNYLLFWTIYTRYVDNLWHVLGQNLSKLITARKRSCGKVMFLHLSLSYSGHEGGMCGKNEAMCGKGGHVWWSGACMAKGVCVAKGWRGCSWWTYAHSDLGFSHILFKENVMVSWNENPDRRSDTRKESMTRQSGWEKVCWQT